MEFYGKSDTVARTMDFQKTHEHLKKFKIVAPLLYILKLDVNWLVNNKTELQF